MTRRPVLRRATVAAVAAALLSMTPMPSNAGGHHDGGKMRRAHFSGTWFLRLDAEPFGLPPGVALPALLTIHSDGTLLIFDAGDFGGLPINQVQSAQLGVWEKAGRRSIRATALFFAGDPGTRDTTLVKRVRFRLGFDGSDHDRLVGVAESVDQLACDAGPTPFGIFSCPNPITAADSDWVPEPGGAPSVPIEAWRLRAR